MRKTEREVQESYWTGRDGRDGEMISFWGQSGGLPEGGGRGRQQGLGSVEFRARIFSAMGTAWRKAVRQRYEVASGWQISLTFYEGKQRDEKRNEGACLWGKALNARQRSLVAMTVYLLLFDIAVPAEWLESELWLLFQKTAVPQGLDFSCLGHCHSAHADLLSQYGRC